jgi:uncharacterized protein YbaP (TraB family)
MSTRIATLLCLSLLANSAWSQTMPEDTPAPTEEQILVVGQKPGPGLWKVSKGEHVLWLFGTYEPLPKKLEWRSHEVEAKLAQSQEFLAPPSSNAKIGFFKKLSLLPHLVGMQKNPDGAELKDLVPPDVYARWLPLKEKYIGKDSGIERKRPLFIADELYTRALYKSGLGNDKEVSDRFEQLLKKSKIKVTQTQIDLELSDPAGMLKEFKKSSLEDAACFAKTLDALETDIEHMRTRADAWAKGDIAEIEKVNFSERRNACQDAIKNSSVVKGNAAFDTLEERMMEQWLVTVDKAMAANTSTFATMPVRRLLEPKGLVSKLEARGYTVEKPE